MGGMDGMANIDFNLRFQDQTIDEIIVDEPLYDAIKIDTDQEFSN